MNEKVTKLYKEARGITVLGDDFIQTWEYKLVELVVEECAKICEDVYPEGTPLHLVALGFGQKIKENFGVK